MIDAKHMNLNELSTATRNNLRALSYGNRTIYMVNSIWRDLEQFLENRSRSPFLPIYGLEYLHERIGYPECLQRKLTPDERDYIRAVRILTSFQETGEIPKALKRNRTEWYEPVRDIRNHYIQYCEETYKTHATQRSRIAAADRFMRIVVVNKQTAWKNISARTISEYAIQDFSPGLIQEYLSWLSRDRRCGISTRNHRLAALRAFFKYVEVESPQHMLLCQKITNIPYTKKEQASVCYLTTEEMSSILRQPDQSSRIGRRDLCFLSLLYDTGARVSEILSLKVRDIHLSNPAKVILYGKGRKLREVPILPNTVLHLRRYMEEQGLSAPEKLDRPFFLNRQENPLTRAGAAYILNKYVQMAGVSTHVSPHVLRHTKAMHLLEAGINIFYIKDFLGHEDISTTEVYAKASIETQRHALEKYSLVMPPATPSWVTNTDTLEWLKSLGK